MNLLKAERLLYILQDKKKIRETVSVYKSGKTERSDKMLPCAS